MIKILTITFNNIYYWYLLIMHFDIRNWHTEQSYSILDLSKNDKTIKKEEIWWKNHLYHIQFDENHVFNYQIHFFLFLCVIGILSSMFKFSMKLRISDHVMLSTSYQVLWSFKNCSWESSVFVFVYCIWYWDWASSHLMTSKHWSIYYFLHFSWPAHIDEAYSKVLNIDACAQKIKRLQEKMFECDFQIFTC